jgi:hypothetical protein
MLPIEIRAVMNGWSCKVGCQELVFTDRTDMLGELEKYLKDPAGTEKRYLKEAVNAGMTRRQLVENAVNQSVADAVLRVPTTPPAGTVQPYVSASSILGGLC